MAPPPARALQTRDPESQQEWLRLLDSEPWVQALQVRTRRRLVALAGELARRADWDSFEVWPTWARLMRASGWARSTMAGWLRQLRVHGWITVVEHGSTPRFRPMGLSAADGNRASVYALRVPAGAAGTEQVPDILQQLAEVEAAAQRRIARRRAARIGPYVTTAPVDETWTPTLSPLGESEDYQRSSFARENVVHKLPSETSVSTEVTEALRARFEAERGRLFPVGAVPTSRAQMLAAAAEICRRNSIAARLSAKAVRALARPYWRAGWSSADVLHALEWRPESWSALPVMPAERVVAPARWLESRLAAWRTARGRVLPGRSQHQHDLGVVASIIGEQALDAALDELGLGARWCGDPARMLGPALPAHQVAAALTPEAIQARGRRAHEELRAEHRLAEACARRDAVERPAPRSAAAAADTRAAARTTLAAAAAERDRRRRAHQDQLLAAAAAAARTTPATPAEPSPAVPADLPPAATPEDRLDRARRRARAERAGHRGHRGYRAR